MTADTLDRLIDDYNQQRLLFDAFRERLQALIVAITQRDESVLSITSRLKSAESLNEKLAKKSANRLAEISDIIGVRIVVNNPKGLDDVLQILKKELYAEIYSVNDLPTDSRYQSIHLAIAITNERARLPEWNSFSGLKAEVQIKTAFAQAFDEVQHLLAYDLAIDSAARYRIPTGVDGTEHLNRIIDDFEALLEMLGVHEKRDVHAFLDEHRFILHPNPEEIWSEVPIGLGTEYRMDFMIREADGEFVLTEIENPQQRLFTREGDFSAAINHAQRQVEDWQDWVEDNIATMQKTYPGIISPRGLVIIGRSMYLSEYERRKLRRRNINLRGRLKIITYDELIAAARKYVELMKKYLQQ
jgi:ppGpp synthetase/RelA/SpoT-type nucleotidyltranferase